MQLILLPANLKVVSFGATSDDEEPDIREHLEEHIHISAAAMLADDVQDASAMPPVKLFSAWSIGEEEREAQQATCSDPKVPCLAVTAVDGKIFTAHILRKSGLGKQAKIVSNSHSFVRLEGEAFFRCALLDESLVL